MAVDVRRGRKGEQWKEGGEGSRDGGRGWEGGAGPGSQVAVRGGAQGRTGRRETGSSEWGTGKGSGGSGR